MHCRKINVKKANMSNFNFLENKGGIRTDDFMFT